MRTGMSIADTYRAFANTLLPKDAYIRCTGVVRAIVEKCAQWRPCTLAMLSHPCLLLVTAS